MDQHKQKQKQKSKQQIRICLSIERKTRKDRIKNGNFKSEIGIQTLFRREMTTTV
jgi:hypothetical protein